MPQTEPEPIKVFCRGCKAKLDMSGLEPFSPRSLSGVRDDSARSDAV